MQLRASDIMSREPLRKLEEREAFLKAQAGEAKAPVQQSGFFNPDPIKLKSLSYKTVLENGYCIINFLGVMGGNVAQYEWKPRSYVPTSKARIFSPEGGHPDLPSYLHVKQMSASQEAGDVIAYLFRDNQKDPCCYPLRLKLKMG